MSEFSAGRLWPIQECRAKACMISAPKTMSLAEWDLRVMSLMAAAASEGMWAASRWAPVL